MNISKISNSPFKVLFILKYREDPWGDQTYNESNGKGLSSGLLNSAKFVSQMLNDNGIESKLVQVIDNNCIDREVTTYKPTHVIIEAFWCVPEKFDILSKLHPNIKWIIRNHSEIPFLANEGIALSWTKKYVEYKNVYISCNNRRCEKAFNIFIDPARNVFLPNYYPVKGNTCALKGFMEWIKPRNIKKNIPLHIACSGAIRPLKNQLLQAIAALSVAKEIGRKLYFHINASRIEMNSNNILKNLQALFENNPHGELVEEPWRDHDGFKDALKKMDAVMQVSYTETFNIVGADAVDIGVPLVASSEIEWSDKKLNADFNDLDDIIKKLKLALCSNYSTIYARSLLKEHVGGVFAQWKKILESN